MADRFTHVVFGHSNAASLRDAIQLAKRDDQVLNLPDLYHFGPINTPNWEVRAAWLKRELDADHWQVQYDLTEAGIAMSRRSGQGLIAWTSWRDCGNFCSFLNWLWRIEETPCDIVDVSELYYGSKKTVRCGALSAHQ